LHRVLLFDPFCLVGYPGYVYTPFVLLLSYSVGKREPAPRCQVCRSAMSRTYVQGVVERKGGLVPVGWCCVACRLMSWD